MKHTLNRRKAALSIGLLAAGGFAQAQEKPAVRILVGFAPGGSADILARLLAEKLRPVLGQNVIVENKPGAAGRLALGDLKRAAPDGLTLCLVGGAALVALPWVFKNVGYDPFKDFTPVAGVTTFDFALTAGPGAPPGDLRALLAWMKVNPSKASYGHSGAGTLPHFTGFLISQATGVSMTHVPYKGAAPAVQDLLAGQIPLVIDTAAETMEHHRAGRLRILAVTGEKRSRSLPDVPTMKEAGVDVASDGFLALYGPPGMAADLVSRLSSAVAEVMKLPDTQDRIVALGQQASYAPAADLARMQAAHYRRWEAPIKASGFTAD